MLPAMDMEHFMYRQGFDDVYHRVGADPGEYADEHAPGDNKKAIHRSSKPDLAIEVAMEAGRRGVDAVPTLLKKDVFPRCCGWRVVALIRGGSMRRSVAVGYPVRHNDGGIPLVFTGNLFHWFTRHDQRQLEIAARQRMRA